jgi:hypothetical protein
LKETNVIFVGESLAPDDLEGHGTAGMLLLGLIHDAHATVTNLAKDTVLTDIVPIRMW